MRRLFAVGMFLVGSASKACPILQGEWACLSKTETDRFEYSLIIEQELRAGTFHFREATYNMGGDLITDFTKAADNKIRTISRIERDRRSWTTKRRSLCIRNKALVTHEEIERTLDGQPLDPALSETITSLNSNGSLSIVTRDWSNSKIIQEFYSECNPK